MAILTIMDGPGKGKQFPLKDTVTRVGRNSANDIVIECPSVSSQHCVVENSGAGIRVRDLDSTNGTRLNGEPVKMAVVFRGDVLTLGDVPVTIDGEDVPQGEEPSATPTAKMAAIPRTTIVIAPKTVRMETPKEFGKRRDYKMIWIIVMGVMAVAIIVAAVAFIKSLGTS